MKRWRFARPLPLWWRVTSFGTGVFIGIAVGVGGYALWVLLAVALAAAAVLTAVTGVAFGLVHERDRTEGRLPGRG